MTGLLTLWGDVSSSAGVPGFTLAIGALELRGDVFAVRSGPPRTTP